ncbi:F-type H+-transporting ATPase subunit a [Friedmanniella endophytica]|uniref:ATP synthase subunit a n=1 Tax=Microlunatus kandeliicorticis TaxID=1759536 RepID=A0A7W3IUN5_9ACTN|nr:F0F1 ATP synthase subunit A [Microlunatus kandeliicorticis]MBA8795547.1 F-type H+-transporting ATPase subunit a [Microlunatus kandeliicorticis]
MGLLIPLLVPMEGYEPPGVQSFDFPPLFPGAPAWVDRYLLQALVAFLLVGIFWLVMARKNKLVPSKGQFVGESAYFFLRDSIGRDMIGHEFRKYLPFLIAVFSFVLVNNLWGIFPLTLLPTASHVGWAYGLAGMVWILYNAIGLRKFGPLGYLKHVTMPPGVPGYMLPIVIPLEFFSNIIVRPITLSLRLFANMLAGHLLVLVFVLGGEYLLVESEPIINKVAGGASLIFSMAIFALEIFVQILQAYIFTVLTAQYISSASSEEH